MRGSTETAATFSMRERILFAVFALPVSMLLPPVLMGIGIPAGSAYAWKQNSLAMLFVFVNVVIVITAASFLWKRSAKNRESAIPIVSASLVAMFFLQQCAMHYWKASADFVTYQYAAEAVAQWRNPYGTGYIYPPLLAQVLAVLLGAAQRMAALTHGAMPPESLLYYPMMCAQWYALLLILLLGSKFLRRIGISASTATLCVSVLLVFNTPVYSTLYFRQINLIVLALLLIAFVYADSHPVWTGMALALGAHLKLYPLLFLLPFCIERRWRLVGGMLAGLVLLLAFQTGFFVDWDIYRSYLAEASEFKIAFYYWDNSIVNIIDNTLQVCFGYSRQDVIGFVPVIRVIHGVFVLLALTWYAFGVLRREAALRGIHSAEEHGFLRDVRTWQNLSGALLVTLLISPVAWEHHFVLAIPALLWFVASEFNRRPMLISVSALLLAFLPTIDVYLFGYHYVAGVVLLLMLLQKQDSVRPSQLLLRW